MGAQGKRRVLLAALALVCVSSGTAMAANKLIVKGTDGTTDKFVVTDSGYIGVGTSAPGFPLHIIGAGDGSVTAFYMQNTGRATGYLASDSPSLTFMRNNASSVNGGLPRSADRLGIFSFGGKVSGFSKYGGMVTSYAAENWTSTSTPGYMSFFTTPSGTSSPVERIRLAATGNVGIGTTNPAAKLDVSGGIRINSSGTKPTCAAGTRGTLWITQGTTDVVQICAMVGNAYAWHSITLN